VKLLLHLSVVVTITGLGLGLLSLYIDGRIGTASLIAILAGFAAVTFLFAQSLKGRK
jgi:hypothetical protein